MHIFLFFYIFFFVIFSSAQYGPTNRDIDCFVFFSSRRGVFRIQTVGIALVDSAYYCDFSNHCNVCTCFKRQLAAHFHEHWSVQIDRHIALYLQHYNSCKGQFFKINKIKQKKKKKIPFLYSSFLFH